VAHGGEGCGGSGWQVIAGCDGGGRRLEE
jgi:hypothetical protein